MSHTSPNRLGEPNELPEDGTAAVPSADAGGTIEGGEELLYHEKQTAALCGVHAINTVLQVRMGHSEKSTEVSSPWSCLSAPSVTTVDWPSLQGPYFSEFDLAHMAHELDAAEQALLAEAGLDRCHAGRHCRLKHAAAPRRRRHAPTHAWYPWAHPPAGPLLCSVDFLQHVGGESANVRDDGMFSIQVLLEGKGGAWHAPCVALHPASEGITPSLLPPPPTHTHTQHTHTHTHTHTGSGQGARGVGPAGGATDLA